MNTLLHHSRTSRFSQAIMKTLFFLIGWAVSLGLVLAGKPHSLFWNAGAIYLAIALGFTVRKFFNYQRELQFLREFHHLSQTLDDIRLLQTDEPFKKILEAVVGIGGFDRAILFFQNDESTRLDPVQFYNVPKELQKDLIIYRRENCLAWKVVDTPEAMIITNPHNNPEVDSKMLGRFGPAALALAPITRGGRT